MRHHVRIQKFPKLYRLGKVRYPWAGKCECGRQWQCPTWNQAVEMAGSHLVRQRHRG